MQSLNRSARRLLASALALDNLPDKKNPKAARVAPFAKYKMDPVGFIEEVLGDKLWGIEESPTGHVGQKGVAEALIEANRVAVAAGRGVGKTWLAARLAIWWLLTRLDSVVVTTAPTWFGVENLLWREMRDAVESSRVPLPGDLLQTQYNMSAKWFAIGLSTDKPVRFRGIHAPGGVLAIFDEAPGVAAGIWDVAKGFLTSGGALFVIGNPHTRSGEFGRAFDPESPWTTFTLSCLDAPHMMGDTVIMDPEWVTDMRKDYGPDPESHPVYQVEVMGQFPDEDDAALFPLSLLNRSSGITPEGNPGRHMGVDLARFGSDRSVAILMVDGKVCGIHIWEKLDTMQSANIVAGLMRKWRVAAEDVHMDGVGVGGGTVDRLRELGYQVDDVGFGESPKGDWQEVIGRSVLLANRRAELFWVARRLLEAGMLSVPDHYHPLRADLAIIPYGYNKKGKLALPEKSKIKADLGRSPDCADSLALALSRPGRTSVRVRKLSGKGRGRRRSRKVA